MSHQKRYLTPFKFTRVLWNTDCVQLSYTGNRNTAGKCNKPKSMCKDKNTTEIIKWLSDCNCNGKGNYQFLAFG